MATHDRTSEKPELRRSARARRDAIPADVRAAAAHAAALHADERVLAALPAGTAIGLYASMRTELSSAPLAAALAAGRFGIPEPSPDLPVVALDDLAVIVVPALLYDRAGYRLGWGGGW